jgi:hypothetical protein
MRAILVAFLLVAASATPALAKTVPTQTERALYCGYSFLLEAEELRGAGKRSAASKAQEEGDRNIRFAEARLHWEAFSEGEIDRLKQKYLAQVTKDRAAGSLQFDGPDCTADAVMNA